MNRYLFLIFFLIGNFAASSQTKEEEKKVSKTYFGVHFSPTSPLNLIQKTNVLSEVDGVLYEINSKMGHSFGMEVRHDFNKIFSLQTGLSYVRRNYDFKANLDTLFENRMQFVGYEIPVMMLAYLRLTKHIYMDNSIGFSANFYPTDIATEHVYGFANRWYQFAMNVNVGWDFRTENSGYFFLGASYHLQLNNALYLAFYEDENFVAEKVRLGVKGSYFAINFKYFFPQREKE
ncbi:MAG TPA: hypothetical protein DDX39_05640 [Bacteroidales bacterium]|nr:MAG: hypothetical protein A2W98_06910 [Bacteroidetes bacterium GWF2_33_38]OFY76172.1 MAG: hypothetical protein A2265_09580 [Bacteroidetes bacterium RIFOXYA12_FULL_33_9]OFY90545.1 MAG: hypothetical protein A2236_05670 [Bacteroidetes bacterium RIFOXYA2_FULL_33_7]HBF88106.1 hypothetical protein [Bacteroidales bacterium]